MVSGTMICGRKTVLPRLGRYRRRPGCRLCGSALGPRYAFRRTYIEPVRKGLHQLWIAKVREASGLSIFNMSTLRSVLQKAGHSPTVYRAPISPSSGSYTPRPLLRRLRYKAPRARSYATAAAGESGLLLAAASCPRRWQQKTEH